MKAISTTKKEWIEVKGMTRSQVDEMKLTNPTIVTGNSENKVKQVNYPTVLKCANIHKRIFFRNRIQEVSKRDHHTRKNGLKLKDLLDNKSINSLLQVHHLLNQKNVKLQRLEFTHSQSLHNKFPYHQSQKF